MLRAEVVWSSHRDCFLSTVSSDVLSADEFHERMDDPWSSSMNVCVRIVSRARERGGNIFGDAEQQVSGIDLDYPDYPGD
jgi:hypothetical protein